METLKKPQRDYCHLGYLLCNAVAENNLIKVKEYIDEGADVHFCDNHPLYLSLHCSDFDSSICSYLLSKGANPHAQKNKFLNYAISCNRKHIVKSLIEGGFNTFTDNLKEFKLALKEGNIEIISYFIEQGHDIDFALEHANKKTQSLLKKYFEIKNMFIYLNQELNDKVNSTSKVKL